jgi:CheY-like chemotaxis protein
MASQLFSTEVATGDTRGTGLGLPSCSIFAEAVGGYCKLKCTKMQDSSGEGGFSEFEFGIRGEIVCKKLLQDDEAPMSDLDIAPQRSFPERLSVVIVEDISLIRKVMKRMIKSVDAQATQGWVFEEFATVEAAQPRLLELANDPMTVVTVDQNMEAKGGVCKGTDLVKWLAKNAFQGMIVSSSGDSDIGLEHLKYGAHVAWGKPLKKDQVCTDILDRFAGPAAIFPQKASSLVRVATAPRSATRASRFRFGRAASLVPTVSSGFGASRPGLGRATSWTRHSNFESVNLSKSNSPLQSTFETRRPLLANYLAIAVFRPSAAFPSTALPVKKSTTRIIGTLPSRVHPVPFAPIPHISL